VVVLGVEAGDHRIAPGHVGHRQHPRRLGEVEPARDGEAEHAVVPLPEVMVGPELGLAGLLRRPHGAVEATELLDLVEVLRVLPAGQRIRAGGPELGCAGERKRLHPGQA
jgi:hypothetical protein